MSDSVGKITLDLEVKSDIEGQVKKVSSIISNTLKLSLNNSTNKVFDNIDKTMKSSLNKVSSNLKNTMDNITNNLKNSISRVSYMLSNIKLPSAKFKPVEIQNTSSNHALSKIVTRGPPVYKNTFSGTDTKSKMLDVINAKIEHQQNKLKSLKESYDNTFNLNKKNKIYEDILKTEESIVRLTSKSDKLGSELTKSKDKIYSDILKTEESIVNLTSKSNKLSSELIKLKDKLASIGKESNLSRNIISTAIGSNFKILDSINAKIEHQQSKLKSLRESYNNTFNSNRKNKIYEDILKTEESIARLTSKSDKLGFELGELDSKLVTLGKEMQLSRKNISDAIGSKTNVLGNINTEIEAKQNKLKSLKKSYRELSKTENVFANSISKTKGLIDRSILKTNKLGLSLNKLNAKTNTSNNLFNRFNNSLKNLSRGLILGRNSTRSFNSGLIFSMKQFFKWMIILPLIQRGIYAMSSSLFASLKTNAQFVNSLNQIKTNLMVAFMPIYQAILPAINALMRALSVITQYIASFISALFGKTYKQSFQAAQGLINAKDAMGAYGKATDKAGNSIEKAGKKAKKAMGDLMGFDEINKLNIQENPDANNLGPNGSGMSSNAPILVQPLLDTSLVDAKMKALVDKIKATMSKIFEPFANAWRKEGIKTINSIKYALNGILSLVKSIGTSFLEVWTNGTGEKILIVILQILQNIFNIIGDISNTFAIAWNNNKIGTKIIQGIANTIHNLLTLIKKMSDSFRKAWEVVGLPLANVFMDILDSTIGILENLSEKFIYVWDHGGSHLFESLIKLGAKIIEISGYVYNNFVAPFVNWFVNLMAPAIAPLMDALGSLFDKFSETIDWLLSDGKPVLDIIISLVGGAAGLAGAFKAAKKGIEIFDGIKSSAERLGNAFINLDPKALLIKLAIAAIIGIGIYLITHWNEIKAKCKEVWENVQKRFQEFKDWLGFVFATDWSKQFGGFGDILNAFLKNVSNIFKSVKKIFDGIINFIKGIFTGNWRKAWSGVVTVFKGIMSGLGAVMKSPLNAVIGLVNGAISGLNKISVSIPDFVPVFGGKKFGFNIPKIPLLAKGGIIDSPTLAMVGEAGKEAVMPLENNTGWITDLANKVADRIPRGESNGNSSIENITIQVGDDTLAKILLSKLKKIQRQTGETVFKV